MKYSLRNLLFAFGIIAVVTAVVLCASKRQVAIQYIEMRGGRVRHEGPWPFSVYTDVNWDNASVTDSELSWIRPINPAGTINLRGNADVTDAGMIVLSKMRDSPMDLDLKGTSVTKKGAELFWLQHPTTDIYISGLRALTYDRDHVDR